MKSFEDARSDFGIWRGLAICIVFIALVCDKTWIAKTNQEAKKLYPARESAEWKAFYQELTQLMKDVEIAGKGNTLTIESTAEFQVRARILISRLDLDPGYDQNIWRVGLESYIHNWKPDPNTDPRRLEELKNEDLRRTWAESSFRREFPSAQARASEKYSHGPLVDGKAWPWLVKWYFLMTIPLLIILLLGRWERGIRLKEDIRPQLALACLCGPLGLLAYALYYLDLVGVAKKYNRAVENFFWKNDRMPSRRERTALWKMVVDGVSFEQALEQIGGSGVEFRRPAMACALAWLMGLAVMAHPTVAKTVKAISVACATTTDLQTGTAKAGDDQSPAQAITPVETKLERVVYVEVYVEEERVKTSWLYQLAENPRAPPDAVEGQHENSFSTLGCQTVKG